MNNKHTYTPLPQPTKSNKQIQEYIDAFEKGGRLVMPNKDGWYVVGPGDRKNPCFKTKSEAIAEAETELVGSQSKVFVFNDNGELTDEYAPHSR